MPRECTTKLEAAGTTTCSENSSLSIGTGLPPRKAIPILGMITGGEPAVDLALVWGAAKEGFSRTSWQRCSLRTCQGKLARGTTFGPDASRSGSRLLRPLLPSKSGPDDECPQRGIWPARRDRAKVARSVVFIGQTLTCAPTKEENARAANGTSWNGGTLSCGAIEPSTRLRFSRSWLPRPPVC